ncbi:hypothetical protein JW916_12025 [Candidatus Sumerlaeota bacterium]|nr:hypothetical protein [Candidatus Sumerlaeota bacterium]
MFFPTTSSASKNHLLALVDTLYEEKGVKSGSDSYPTLADVDRRLDPSNYEGKIPSQDLQRMHTLRNKTAPLVRLLGSMMGEDPGLPMDEILSHDVVLELDGLTAEYQEFFINILLYWIFTYRIENGQRGRLRHALVFDEAKLVYARDRATPTSYITRLTCMSREYGEGILACEQMPSCLGEGIKANVFTTLALNLSSMRDIQATAYTLGLNNDQRQWLMSQPIGCGVLRMADRYTKPFAIRIPRVEIEKDVTDREVEEYMRPILARMAGRKSDAAPPSSANHEAASSPSPGMNVSERRLLGHNGSDIPEPAIRLLTDIRDHPYDIATARYRRLELSARQGTQSAGLLVSRGLVSEVTIRTGIGRPGKFYEMSSEGVQKIGAQKLGPGKGGFQHKFCQNRIREHFESLGYRAQIEAYLDGKSVDVGVWKTMEKLAVEVAMTAVHERENVIKDFRAGWDRIAIVFLDEAVRRSVEEELGADPEIRPFLDRIEFVPFARFAG